MKNAITFTASTVQIEIKCDSSIVHQEQEGIPRQTERPLSSSFFPSFVNAQQYK